MEENNEQLYNGLPVSFVQKRLETLKEADKIAQQRIDNNDIPEYKDIDYSDIVQRAMYEKLFAREKTEEQRRFTSYMYHLEEYMGYGEI